jgi:hypothetical protein
MIDPRRAIKNMVPNMNTNKKLVVCTLVALKQNKNKGITSLFFSYNVM